MELFQQKKFKIKQHSCLIMEYNSVWIECIIGDNNIIGSNHTVPSVDKKICYIPTVRNKPVHKG